MISVEVRSANGRPNASTPVTCSGTACTIRVLRRFLNSSVVFVAPSIGISLVSSVGSGPPGSSCMVAVNSLGSSLYFKLWLLLLGWILLAVRTRHGIPYFFRDPDWPNQQIHTSPEKCGLFTLHPVAQVY